MAVVRQHINEAEFYFITFTNYRWLPLFEMTQSYDLVCQWFTVLEQQWQKVAGKWELVKDAVAYPHSSCAFYMGDDNREIPLVHFMEIEAL